MNYLKPKNILLGAEVYLVSILSMNKFMSVILKVKLA